MEQFGTDRSTAFEGLRGLESDHHILLVPGTQRILMANPYSAVTTPFRVYVGDRLYFANCAWDTVSMHVMLERDVRIESYCHHCADQISLSLSRGKVVTSNKAEPLIFLSTPVARWYENLINTCSNNMVYFSSRRHMQEWLGVHPELKGEDLTVEKMAEVCQPLSSGRASLEYERPSKEKLTAYWDSVGMESDFWKF